MLMLALCHTIITDKKYDKKLDKEVIEYNASSPDELALLNFAKYMGFEFISNEDNVMTVKIQEETF